MHHVGRIVRLQVQVAPLKRGVTPHRWYDPSRIRPVDRLTVGDDGVLGHDGDLVLVDVHHRRHPQSRHRRPASGLSLGFTSHYTWMRDRFGTHLADGAAGENVLVETDRRLGPEDLAGGLVIHGGATARRVLGGIEVAEPCVEFSRFAAPGHATGVEPLPQLRGGVRGFYAVPEAGPWPVMPGEDLWVGVP